MGFDEILEKLGSGQSLTRQDISKILDDIIASTRDRTMTKEDLEMVAGRAQALKERIADYRAADVIAAESRGLMRLAASQPSKFTTYYPKALAKAMAAKELRRGIPRAYTAEEKAALIAFAKKLAGRRR